jgi:mono/diheme cytochrome c family protein
MALLVGLAACGGDDDGGGAAADTTTAATSTAAESSGGDAAGGEEVFASAGCGGCHTLAAAGSTGTTGPNLDDLQPDFDRVVRQVTNGGAVMPAFGDTLSEQQINDVAAFVSENAGNS